MGVNPKIGVIFCTPKSSHLFYRVWFSIIFTIHFGVSPYFWFNTHMFRSLCITNIKRFINKNHEMSLPGPIHSLGVNTGFPWRFPWQPTKAHAPLGPAVGPRENHGTALWGRRAATGVGSKSGGQTEMFGEKASKQLLGGGFKYF